MSWPTEYRQFCPNDGQPLFKPNDLTVSTSMQHAHSRAQIHLMHWFTLLKLQCTGVLKICFASCRSIHFVPRQKKQKMSNSKPWDVLIGTGLDTEKHPLSIRFDAEYILPLHVLIFQKSDCDLQLIKTLIALQSQHITDRYSPTTRAKPFPI